MRITKLIGVSTLSLFLGTSALMYAQEEKPSESRPAETQKDKSAPAPNRQSDMAKPQENREQTGKMPEQSEDKNVRGEDRSHQDARQDQKQTERTEHNAQMNDSRQDHAQRAQAGGNRGGGHIPDEKFRSSFGRQHTFVVNRPASGGQPQFQYGGYTFNIIDAWPADWSYSDQVYVDYVDGQYFLYDLAHPGVSVAIVVVM